MTSAVRSCGRLLGPAGLAGSVPAWPGPAWPVPVTTSDPSPSRLVIAVRCGAVYSGPVS